MNIVKPFFKGTIFFILLFLILFVSCDKEIVGGGELESVILFPNEGGAFLKGSTYTVTWTDNKSSSVRIKLFKSGVSILRITNSTENNGKFQWTLPDDIEEGNDYTIKINSNSDDFIYAESESPFSVINKPSEYSEFIDIRDGQVYKTVKIGTQWWMAQNFNYQPESGSYCYNNNYNLCEEFGSLYQLSYAKSLAPPGWHLPSDSEWKTMETYLGVHGLNDEGYRGSNIGLLLKEGGGLEFDAKYAGYSIPRYGRYFSLNDKTFFWTSTYASGGSVYWARELSPGEDGMRRMSMSGSYYAFSVRYVKDEEK